MHGERYHRRLSERQNLGESARRPNGFQSAQEALNLTTVPTKVQSSTCRILLLYAEYPLTPADPTTRNIAKARLTTIMPAWSTSSSIASAGLKPVGNADAVAIAGSTMNSRFISFFGPGPCWAYNSRGTVSLALRVNADEKGGVAGRHAPVGDISTDVCHSDQNSSTGPGLWVHNRLWRRRVPKA